MKIKCLIIDDEQLAIDLMENHLNRIDDFEIINTFTDPLKAYQTIENESIDVIFLDINMPQINGFNFIKNLSIKPLVVFSTAHREYAIKSYEFNVLDYLVKPIKFERLLKTINKIRHNVYNKEAHFHNRSNEDPHIFLRTNRKILKVRIKDILYLESLKDYVRVHTIDQNHIIHSSLTAVTEELKPTGFLRVHNSFTISLPKVDAINGNIIEIDKNKIPIGRKYKENVKKIILDNYIK